MPLNLTTALALLGLAVLLGLLLHGWWSARRAAPRDAALRTADAAAGLGPERIEPALGGDGPTPTPLPAIRPPRRSARLDALIDAIVPLTLEPGVSAIAGDAALAHAGTSRRAGSKPMFIEGLHRERCEWEALAAGEWYTEFQAGVQLANRAGALNEIEYSEFVQKVQAFAEGIGVLADFPDMLEVVARARELDAFAGPLDAQLQLKLRANSVAWSPAFVQQAAARSGFVSGALPGRLVLPAAEEGAPPVLVLSFDPQAALADSPQAVPLREVHLSLDVPQTPESAEPFPQWHRAAHVLAEALDAEVCDDQGAPVTLHAFDLIAKELTTLYRALEVRDLAAGSPAARRLFSG
jgi:hypothetical protein